MSQVSRTTTRLAALAGLLLIPLISSCGAMHGRPSSGGGAAPAPAADPGDRAAAAGFEGGGEGRGRGGAPASPGVKAGSADDNLQFNAFLDFLVGNGDRGIKCDVSRRVIVEVSDRAGLPLADASVVALDGGKPLASRLTYSDGRTLLFPSEDPALQRQSVKVRVSYRDKTHEALLNTSDRHRMQVKLDLTREKFDRVPLDIVFIVDTTGSMGDEIAQLKKTLALINFQISRFKPAPDVRFGMVLFRDKGDDYRTRTIPFTSDVKAFGARLNRVRAGGGGDIPEDVQEGLKQAMQVLKWRSQGVKLAFLVGDAPPHLDYGQTFTYVSAMQDAARRGIKIATIGASGLDRRGEVVWRQLAQYTMAPFVFLTRGEKGDAEGSPSSVSHHVGSNWVAENLDAIIIRMVKVELGHYRPDGSPPVEDYFTAAYDQKITPAAVMEDLFRQSVKQLVNYSVWHIGRGTPTMILPVKVAGRALAPAARKLETHLSLHLGRAHQFQLIESKDKKALIKLQNAQLSDRHDDKKVVELGKIVPARLVVFSRLQETGGQLELLIKLVRMETGEILSLSLLKIEKKLLD